MSCQESGWMKSGSSKSSSLTLKYVSRVSVGTIQPYCKARAKAYFACMDRTLLYGQLPESVGSCNSSPSISPNVFMTVFDEGHILHSMRFGRRTLKVSFLVKLLKRKQVSRQSKLSSIDFKIKSPLRGLSISLGSKP